MQIATKKVSEMPSPKNTEVTFTQKIFVLLLLVVQNASVVIMTRYSRAIAQEEYLASSVVLATEVAKICVASAGVYMQLGSSYLNSQPWPLTKKIWYLLRNSGYTWVPATCYFIQNTLQYVALENLPSSVYAVLQQLKILSAALFSVAIVGKKLPPRQWRALLLLVAGGVLIENHTFQMHANGEGLDPNQDPSKGTIAILTIICLSGLAGVISQLLLQNKPTPGSTEVPVELSIWDRNVQLAFWSMTFGVVNIGFDSAWLAEHGGFFAGWTINTVIILFLWTSGGILVAITIKYTDVIVKGFASAISLVCISIMGWVLLGDPLDLVFGMGALVTIIATFNYNERDAPSTGTMVSAPKSALVETVIDPSEVVSLTQKTRD